MRSWDELIKKQQKHVREMAGVAYERALAAALDKLLASFQKMETGRDAPPSLLTRKSTNIMTARRGTYTNNMGHL